MATIQESSVMEALRTVKYPGYSRDIVSFGLVKGVQIDGGAVGVLLELSTPNPEIGNQIADAAKAALRDQIEGITDAHVQVQVPPPTSAVSATPANTGVAQRNRMPGVRRVVAVASGKGGVGKSTVAVNLAIAWAAQGARVGLLDADIYGPSQPIMLGLQGQRPSMRDGKRLIPLSAHGVVAMSIGFLVDVEQPLVLRGPMVTSALNQLLSETDWGDLDYLVVDLPPGTGDIQLTLAQRVPLSGAVIVTTPQDIALADARKGLRMFEKVNVPVLGIVENMALHVCTQCGHTEPVFGEGGGARMAAQYGVQLLGSLPLDGRIRAEADSGRPSVVADPASARALAYLELARHAAGELSRRSRDRSAAFPKIIVEDT